MPRSFGSFTTSIWHDPDFTSLTIEEQGAYFTLGLQPDISAAGVLPLTPGRWAKLSKEMTRPRFAELVQLLVDCPGRHLVTDEDTEEVLLRKFAKWDKGWANAKRRPVLLLAVGAIQSAQLRDIAVDELWKIVRERPRNAASAEDKRSRDALSEALKEAASRSTTPLNQYLEPEPQPSPITGNLEREPAEPLSPFCTKHPDGTEQPCQPCGTARTRYAEHVKNTVGAEADRRRAAAARASETVLTELEEAKARAVPPPHRRSA